MYPVTNTQTSYGRQTAYMPIIIKALSLNLTALRDSRPRLLIEISFFDDNLLMLFAINFSNQAFDSLGVVEKGRRDTVTDNRRFIDA